MNVQELGTGRVNIGYFFLTALSAGGFIALLSFTVKLMEQKLQQKRQAIATEFEVDVSNIQKREILRQSKLGERLCKGAGFDEIEGVHYDLSYPGPKLRKAAKFRASNYWKKLVSGHKASTTGQQTDCEVVDRA